MAVDELIKLLSTAFRKDPDSTNYKLLKVIDSEFTNIEQTINNIKNAHAHFVDHAEGKSLDYIASLFNVRRLQNETDEHFRARIKLTFSLLKCTTTVNELKEIIAAVLNTETNRIRVKDDYNEPAYLDVWVWLQDLSNAGITDEELKTMLQTIKPAGVRLEVIKFGTFEYRSASDVSDPTKGYNDLANSNPDAGTYAGLL